MNEIEQTLTGKEYLEQSLLRYKTALKEASSAAAMSAQMDFLETLDGALRLAMTADINDDGITVARAVEMLERFALYARTIAVGRRDAALWNMRATSRGGKVPK